MTSGRSPFADDPPAYGPTAPYARDPAHYDPASWDPAPYDSGPSATRSFDVPSDEVWAPAPIEYAPPFAASRRRGQWLSWTVLVLAVVVAAALGTGAYLGLATVRLSAPDPWDTAWTWLTLCAGAAVAAAGVFLLGLLALLVSRPKLVAAVATAAALVLPVAALAVALWFGVAEAARHAELDGAALLDLLTAGLDRLGASAGPVRDVFEWVVRVVAGRL